MATHQSEIKLPVFFLFQWIGCHESFPIDPPTSKVLILLQVLVNPAPLVSCVCVCLHHLDRKSSAIVFGLPYFTNFVD
jgi:hypothetical protein